MLASLQQNQNLVQQAMTTIASSYPSILPSLNTVSFHPFLGNQSHSPFPQTPGRTKNLLVRASNGGFKSTNPTTSNGETHKPSEGILTCINRFHDRAMECYELEEEIQLVKICLDGMQPHYKPLLVNLHLPTFAKLLVSAQNLGDSMRLSFTWSHWRSRRGLFSYVTKRRSSHG